MQTGSMKSDAPGVGAAARGVSRRGFVGRVLAGAGAASAVGLPALAARDPNPDAALSGRQVDLLTPAQRADKAYMIRVQAAAAQRTAPIPDHPTNGDEARYSTRIASFTKGLPHNNLGEVTGAAYNALLTAVGTGSPRDFEAIPMGFPGVGRKLINPQAGLAFELEGGDAAAFYMPPAPAFASAERAGEMVELYWQALLRDVPCTEYASNRQAMAAANDLSRLSDFRGPKVNGRVTTDTLFRGTVPGCTVGPWISQFFYHPMPIGSSYIEGKTRTLLPGVDYVTQYAEWLNLQRGAQPTDVQQYDPEWRYPRSGRDMAQWVHMDLLYQAYFQAMVCLLAGPSDDPKLDGMGAPFDSGNPYARSANQEGFVTFGGPHICTLLTEVASRCMKAQWFQKWFVHRVLRPEVFGGRVHNHLTRAASYPIGAELLNSPALPQVYSQYGTYLLPQAFVEGSPLHPAYGSGHATVAGACVTILKAWFDENWVLPDPVVATPDGLSLVPYNGPALTLGGELNKLAWNVAMGRDFAGIHWRSDGLEAMELGEAYAISVLRDQRMLYNEPYLGLALTKFDGSVITV